MKIGIDATEYDLARSGGKKWYSYHLFNNLIPLLGRDHHQEIRLYLDQDFKNEMELPFNVQKNILPLKSLWLKWRLSLEILIRPVDVLFIPSAHIPFFAPNKTIVMIHDLSFEHIRDPKQFWRNWRKRRHIKRAVAKAHRLIVPTMALKQDLIKLYGCREEKVIVIPYGALEVSPLQQWSVGERRKKRKQFFLGESDLFILVVGRLETQKNLERLSEAFQRFLGEFPDWKMVFAGERGDGFEKIWKKVLELKLDQQIIVPGYVTEEEKAFLYHNCRLVAFSPLYEGFGMPVLEAFAHRRPVLASKISALTETAGDAAYFINPEKVEEISVGLKRLASDGMLASRLIQKGEIQVRKFSWEKTAAATYEVLLN